MAAAYRRVAKVQIDERPGEQEMPETAAEPRRPEYEPPQITCYDESDLADIIGPAVACARWDPI
jgi:hypothetical protein